jgi:CHRD domain/PEP-CTERM motif
MPRERTTEAIIMKRLSSSILLAAALLLTVPFSQATPITFIASLTGASESPPTGSPGIGFATVLLDIAAQTMQVIVSFSGLLSPTTASHIHCCTPPGTNAIVATGVPTFLGFPLGVTSGTYDHVFDLTLASTYNPAFVTAHGGTVAGAEATLIAGLLAGQAYLNIHTTQFGGGEIRGFLTVVPEPSTLLLLGAGLAVLGIGRRKLK